MVNDSIDRVIFGAESRLRATESLVEVVPTNVEELTCEPLYIVVALLFVVIYLAWLPYVVRSRGVRWSRLVRPAHGKPEDGRGVVAKQQIGVFIISWALGITLLSLYFLRLSAQFLDIAAPLDWGVLLPLSVGGTLFMVLYSWVVLKLGGYLTLQPEFVDKINSLKLQMLFFLVILLSPLFVVSSFATLSQGAFVLQLSVFVLIILAGIFIRQSFLLFMRQNFSILHWILYLCGVEIFPLTLLWAIAVRSYGFGI